jgi:hypothetical protein
MDSLDDTKLSSKMGFFKYLFKFDEDIKAEILNIVQYSIIAFIPVILLNKGMQQFVPEADEDKGSFETLAEVLLQIIVMFIVLYYINRIVLYVPTYSEQKYPEFSVLSIILAVLMITMSLQTKLGEKVSILYERVVELWEGNSKDKKKKKGASSGNVKVIQPFTNQHGGGGQTNDSHAMNQAMYQNNGGGSTQINDLPTQMPAQQPQMGGEYMLGGGPMAANEVLGGSAFGANF